MEALSALLAGRGAHIELDEAALQLATIEYPQLEIESFLRLLDSHAARIGDRLPAAAGFVAAANHYLFEEVGFIGNEEDYYNPANSCLNEVLTSKRGIPITLSVIYIEIARRLKQPVFGIGLPGHFLVEYNDGFYSTYIDVFRGGRLLEASDCYTLAGAAPDVALLARVGKEQIIARMINNLRGIYFSRGAHRKSIQVLSLLLEANPRWAELYRQRGVAHLQLEQIRAAKADLERYLELAPGAPDREAVEGQLVSLARWLVSMN
jgi:regulator of sirC expression with transglutaminase-like and TPR domain